MKSKGELLVRDVAPKAEHSLSVMTSQTFALSSDPRVPMCSNFVYINVIMMDSNNWTIYSRFAWNYQPNQSAS
jgi:hypothetical protein